MPVLIENATTTDVDSVKEIEIESGLSSWSKADYLSELDRADSLFFIAAENSEVVGFILARLIMYLTSNSEITDNSDINDSDLYEIEIYNIAVKSTYRNRSVGSALLEKIFQKGFETNTKKIHLEVRKSNSAAIEFYSKNGFEVIGTRRNFYTCPTEDALLMSRPINRQKNP